MVFMAKQKISVILALTFSVFLMFSFINCQKSTTGTPPQNGNPASTPDISRLSPNCFQSANAIPTHTNGTFIGSFAIWNDPSVLKVENKYVMYASSPGDSSAPDYNIQIYRFESNDLSNWTLNPSVPVLSAGTAGTWNEKGVETPSVIYFQNQYHMFYTGYKNSPDSNPAYAHHENFKIGHAISSNGINFTKDSGFVLEPTCPNWTVTNQICTDGGNHPTDFNAWLVGEPGAVVFNNKIYLYFTANGYHTNITPNNPLQVIGLTTSIDGNTWTTPSAILEPDPVLFPRVDTNNGNSDLWVGYSTPNAIVLGGQMHLFYDVASNISNQWRQRKLHHSMSADGQTQWVQDSAVIYSHTDFPWTNREIRSPSLLLDGTTLLMWFAGDDGGTPYQFGIGLSRCSL